VTYCCWRPLQLHGLLTGGEGMLARVPAVVHKELAVFGLRSVRAGVDEGGPLRHGELGPPLVGTGVP
jgi:hypothetical protein